MSEKYLVLHEITTNYKYLFPFKDRLALKKTHATITGIVITPLAFIKVTECSETERDFCDPLVEKLHNL